MANHSLIFFDIEGKIKKVTFEFIEGKEVMNVETLK